MARHSELLYYDARPPCPGTRSGRHVLEWDGAMFWCIQCGRLLVWEEDDEGFHRLVPFGSDPG